MNVSPAATGPYYEVDHHLETTQRLGQEERGERPRCGGQSAAGRYYHLHILAKNGELGALI